MPRGHYDRSKAKPRSGGIPTAKSYTNGAGPAFKKISHDDLVDLAVFMVMTAGKRTKIGNDKRFVYNDGYNDRRAHREVKIDISFERFVEVRRQRIGALPTEAANEVEIEVYTKTITSLEDRIRALEAQIATSKG